MAPVVIGGLLNAPATAATTPPANQPKSTPAGAAELSSALGPDWYKSQDLAVSGIGDSEGYHLSIAKESEGFAWRPLATIQPGGQGGDDWTGYQCTTGSGKHVVVSIAPSHFANYPTMRDRGALAYVVDVDSGRVRSLTAAVALKYYSPGCGAGDTAVLTRSLDTDQARTELLTVDAEKATIVEDRIVGGQITSAVPSANNTVFGALGNSIVKFDAKSSTPNVQTQTDGQPYNLVPSKNDVTYLSAVGNSAKAYTLANKKASLVGDGPLTSTGLFMGRGGKAIAYGLNKPKSTSSLNALTTKPIEGGALPDVVSLDGDVVVQQLSKKDAKPELSTSSTKTSKKLGNTIPDVATTPNTELPAVVGKEASTTSNDAMKSSFTANSSATTFAAASNTTTPTCSVPRNSPTRQVPQPGRQQVEWAVNQAVRNNLVGPFARPSNFLNMGLASYAPNTDFSRHALSNSPSTPVPPSVMEAIMAQESNWNQASWHALPGIAGNPLIADYYGSNGSINSIDYDAADCGYGIAQVTTNMRTSDTGYSANGKTKVAVDYAENISAGLQILQDKWNQLQSLGITANNNDPKYVENWYFAVWAYNTGVHTPADANGMWGLGWTNNPQNADYPPNREGFLRASYADASHPGNWPYQERVFGWVETPQLNYKGEQSYSQPTYGINSPINRSRSVLSTPSYSSFCDSTNACSPTYVNGSQSYCQLSGRNCYWHSPVQFANCSNACAQGTFVYSTTAAEPTTVNPHPPACNSTLPSNAIIVDDLAEPVYNVAGCGSRNWTSRGTFALTQGTDASGAPISLIDTHQIGAGLGGHIYFTHNRLASDASHLVTGTWTPPTLATQSYHLYAHLPSTGATSNSAHYKVTTSNGTVIEKVIDQHQQQDQWMGLGYFALGANAKVTLNNVSDDSTQGVHDIAWDGLAFVPVAGTVVNHSFDAVSIFDFNQDMNTNAPWIANTPLRTMTTLHDWALQYSSGGPCWNGNCQGNYMGIASYPTCTSGASATCVMPATRAAAQSWYNDVVAGGSSTTNHTPTMSEAKWMAFSVPVPPNTINSSTFAADDSYKIKTHIDTSFLVNNGTIVPGSEESRATYRTGNTHAPTFVTGLINGISSDYGIAPPDLSFSAKDLNTYSNDASSSNLLTTGETPGRAYAQFANPAQVINNNQCVALKAISGGSIGWRPLVAQDAVRNAMANWASQVAAKRQAGLVPQAVSDTAAEINNMFFNGGSYYYDGSVFKHAPPIWQQVNAKVCVDGTISTTGNSGTGYTDIAEQSYMPDLYLYYDGHLINQQGAPTSTPVKRGDFLDFSNSPANAPNGNPYDACDFINRGAGGNPWSMLFSQDADTRPMAVHFCDEPGVQRGGEWSP